MPPRSKKPQTLEPTYLRNWRLFRRLTQEKAAERIGIDYTTLGRTERGLVPYQQPLLEDAAKVYECKPWDLLHIDPMQNARIVDLMDLLKDATPEMQAEIIGYARGRLGKS